MKYGNLNFLELSGPVQACNGTDLLFITHSEYVPVALVIEHANGMRRIVLTFMACTAVKHFSQIIS